jgi:hypothetical protein
VSEVETIQGKLELYPSEYAVQAATQNITSPTADYHASNYGPDILQVFRFHRLVDVVQLSETGTELPKLYVVDNATRRSDGTLTIGEISKITQINSEEPFSYSEKLGSWELYIDIDGRMNNLFYSGYTQILGNFEYQN